MKKEDIIFSRKEFLNLAGQESMANIVCHITKQHTQGDGSYYPDITLSVADCDRKVSMYLDLEDEYDIENSMHKVDTLIDVLTEFRRELKKEATRQKRFKKKRKD